MRSKLVAVLICVGMFTPGSLAKQKQPATLPPWLLKARTVAVLVDPQAGVALEDPNANQVAQRDVEAALANWGRFQPVMGAADADLLIVIRRGHTHLAEPTVSDPRQNQRTGSVTPTDTGIGVGVQHGRQPFGDAGSPPDANHPGSPGTHAEIGGTEDLFAVYRGNSSGDNADPLDSPPAWRLSQKNALKPHSVPAVEQFRNAVAEADKAAAAAQQHP